jgi:hypothetical protein
VLLKNDTVAAQKVGAVSAGKKPRALRPHKKKRGTMSERGVGAGGGVSARYYQRRRLLAVPARREGGFPYSGAGTVERFPMLYK